MRRLTETRGGIYIEALVALAILTIALIPLIGAFALTPAAQQESGQHLVAMNLARERLEELHGKWDTQPYVFDEVDLDGVFYRVERWIDPLEEDHELYDRLLNVRVTVTWPDRKGEARQVTLATSVARRP